jgi:hypothetical protein
MQRGASERTAPKTTVQLIGFRSPYRDECPRDLDAIAHRLFAHILPLFLDPDVPAITLADEATEIDLRAFFDEQFRAPASKHEFKVGGRDFTLHGFRLYGGAADHHELVYGAHYREVITERLAKFLPNLTNRLPTRRMATLPTSPSFREATLTRRSTPSAPTSQSLATPRSGHLFQRRPRPHRGTH